MDVYEKVQQLLLKKEKEVSEESDLKKCEFIRSLLNKRELFFSINKKTISGILVFLGIDDEQEMINLYKELISIENYKKYVPKERIIIK